jgi:tetratricopeptide (TPR) repeat protein
MSWDLGDHELALREGLAAVTVTPEDRDAMEALACGYIYTGLPERAIPVAERLLALNPDDQRALHVLGDALQTAGRSGDSERVFAQHVDRFPLVGTAYELLAINALKRGERAAAVDWIRRGHVATGDVNWLILGEALWASGARKDAHRAWWEGKERYEAQPEPRRPRGRVWLAMLYARLRFPEFAQEQLDLALRDDPSNSYLEYRAACATGMMGAPEAAVALLRASREHGFRCVQLCRLEEPIYLCDLAGHPAYKEEISALEDCVRELGRSIVQPPTSSPNS